MSASNSDRQRAFRGRQSLRNDDVIRYVTKIWCIALEIKEELVSLRNALRNGELPLDGPPDRKNPPDPLKRLTPPLSPTTPSASVRAKAKPKATTLPEDWEPDDSNRAYAEERGLDPDEMLPEWRNYWCYEGGKNVKRVDWSLTWKDRCRTLAKRQGGNGQARPGRNDAGRGGVVAAMRELWLEENDGCLPH